MTRLARTGRGPRWWFMLLLPLAGWIVLVVFFSKLGRTEPTPT